VFHYHYYYYDHGTINIVIIPYILLSSPVSFHVMTPLWNNFQQLSPMSLLYLYIAL